MAIRPYVTFLALIRINLILTLTDLDTRELASLCIMEETELLERQDLDRKRGRSNHLPYLGRQRQGHHRVRRCVRVPD